MDWQVFSLFFCQKTLFTNSVTSESNPMLYRQEDSSVRFADEDLTPGATCARTCVFTPWKNLSSANTARSPFRSLQRFGTTPDFTPEKSLTSAMYVTSRTRSLQDCGLIRSLLDIGHYMRLLKRPLKNPKVLIFTTTQITASVQQTLPNWKARLNSWQFFFGIDFSITKKLEKGARFWLSGIPSEYESKHTQPQSQIVNRIASGKL